jgi:arginyl-tRNA synthetase
MIDLYSQIIEALKKPLSHFFESNGTHIEDFPLAPPTREDAGDLSLPCHSYAKALRKAPQQIAQQIADALKDEPLLSKIEAVNGFLNFRLNWVALAPKILDWSLNDEGAIGKSKVLENRKIVIEYSAPNTNKPQHLGHCRNNMLGATMAKLMQHAGAEVIRVNLINDRGIHICKSMLAYQLFGNGVTPESTGIKGDHLVGDFYVKFDKAFTAEYKEYLEKNQLSVDALSKDDFFNTQSELGLKTRQMLEAWEANDPSIHALWRLMNGWCEAGFNETYQRMGVGFEKVYRESETYLLGKDLIAQGLENGVFYQNAKGAIVFDQSKIGLEGEKVVLRSNGTSVYITQDLGTAMLRKTDYACDEMIYVVGDEQARHFQVLFGILSELEPSLKGKLHHLSYGMVELPDGKMKSREGTVVDADDLMDEMRAQAMEIAKDNWPDISQEELLKRAEIVALSGLKFFLLKYAPPTTFIFDKEKSIKPEGETGVYCQYAYARGGKILEKLPAGYEKLTADYGVFEIPVIQELLKGILKFPKEAQDAAVLHKPNLVTKALFDISKAFSTFYNHPDCNVLKAKPEQQKAYSLLVLSTRRIIKNGLALLGIEVLEEL